MKSASIVLAAGASTRMKSKTSKLLHHLLGKTVAYRAYTQASLVSDEVVFVIGHQAEELKAHLHQILPESKISFCLQEPPLGTADAVRKAVEFLSQSSKQPDYVFIMGGDSVLLRKESLEAFVHQHCSRSAVMSFMTCVWPNESSYGRIVRDKGGNPRKIVEWKNASPEERQIQEVNAGFYLIDFEHLKEAIHHIPKNSLTNEFYLTDLVEYFYTKNHLILSFEVSDTRECLGINTPGELSEAEKILSERVQTYWMSKGVFFHLPETSLISDEVELASDVHIGPGCVIEGKTKIKESSIVEAHCIIRSSVLEESSHIKAFSHLEGAHVGKFAQVGPYARLRTGSKLMEEVRIGNFVEVKNSILEKRAKANHLSYIGDAEVGEETNIGAGTITCNYDGFSKHKTKIGKSVFIGSNSSIVAPVEIAKGAIIGAGSVITKNVAEDSIAVERNEQRELQGAAKNFRERRKKGSKS